MHTRPVIFWLVIALLLFIFFGWLFRVIVPVVGVELTYQYKKVLRDVFHVNTLRGLIWPQITIDMRGYTSSHTTNGITIPAIFIDEPVIYNIDPNDQKAYTEALKLGIAHASGTAFPGTGGFGYYFAHSSTEQNVRQYNAVFYLLGKLKPGDEIYIWHEGKRFDYQVTGNKITDPSDVSFLKDTPNEDHIVLQTCWPPGTSLKRLLIFAKPLPNL